MPELPEVETVRRLMERVLGGKRILAAEAANDSIVLSGHSPREIVLALKDRKVLSVGRKGKCFWIELDEKPWLFGHLGMTGWIREVGGKESRLKDHGAAPLEDEHGRLRFLKLLIEVEGGARVAFTDGRRLGRIWLGNSSSVDNRIRRLGPDAFLELPNASAFHKLISARQKAVKTVLMDQSILSGIGNWVADEALYHARIAPARTGASLSESESSMLRKSIQSVLKTAIEADAEFERFPKTWLFHHRWGGKRGSESIGGKAIVRETIGGRTAAWVPDVQK